MARNGRRSARTALAAGFALLAAFPASAAGPFPFTQGEGMFPFFQQGGPGFSQGEAPQGPFASGSLGGEGGPPFAHGDGPRAGSGAFPMAEGGPAGSFGGPPMSGRAGFREGPNFDGQGGSGAPPIVGFVAGFVAGAASSPTSDRYELEPWSADWYHYCANRYRTFDARTGTVLGSDGNRHFCSPN